ncbi:MAG: hypothetical protein LC128_02370 [Chitinophagales bacterium]|nr:hypothetical protein [Chitinophagales bacterium]
MKFRKNDYLISYHSLRQLIGILGILLPFLCWAINTFVNHIGLLDNPWFVDKNQTAVYVAGPDLKPSISHFYYTVSGPLFTGILITVSVFLFCYTGYPKNEEEDRWAWLTDKKITAFAACCALGIVIFPTDSAQKITDNIYIFVSSGKIGRLHLTFAVLFFLSMAVMSIINFRRHPGKKLLSDEKGKLYLICGWGIIGCILLLSVYNFSPSGSKWLWGKFVYIMEVVMLIFFGIAWLTKGKSFPTEYILKRLHARNTYRRVRRAQPYNA